MSSLYDRLLILRRVRSASSVSHLGLIPCNCATKHGCPPTARSRWCTWMDTERLARIPTSRDYWHILATNMQTIQRFIENHPTYLIIKVYQCGTTIESALGVTGCELQTLHFIHRRQDITLAHPYWNFARETLFYLERPVKRSYLVPASTEEYRAVRGAHARHRHDLIAQRRIPSTGSGSTARHVSRVN